MYFMNSIGHNAKVTLIIQRNYFKYLIYRQQFKV